MIKYSLGTKFALYTPNDAILSYYRVYLCTFFPLIIYLVINDYSTQHLAPSINLSNLFSNHISYLNFSL